MMRLAFLPGSGVLLFVLAGPIAAFAQTAAPPTQPTVQFPAGGIGLLESVQLGLQHAPTIQIQRASTDLQQGVAREQSGAFDATLRSAVNFDRRIQELTESRKNEEREKRIQLRDGIAENRHAADRARAVAATLQQVRQTPASTPQQLTTIASIDPSTATQLQLMETLIRTQPQVAPQLLQLRQEFIDSTVLAAQAGLQQGIAEFERQERLLQQIGEAPFDEFFRNGFVNIEMSKAFRIGAIVTPFFDGGLDGTNYVGKQRHEDFGGKGIFDVYTFHAGADGSMPLLRGGGRASFGAPEQASRFQAAASQATLQHEAAATTLDIVRAYWALRAAQDNVEVASRSLGLQSKLRELTQALIQASDLAQVESARVQATEARAQARLRDAERARHEARVTLAQVMGLAVTDDPATLPVASDPFPPLPDPAAVDPAQLPGRMQQAVTTRNDLRAAQQQYQAGEVLARAARRDRLPLLDLQGGLTLTGLEEGIVGHALDRWVGPSTNISVNFEKPLGNNRFGGRFEQRDADRRRLQVLNTDLQRTARLGVVRASQSLREAVARAQQAEASVGFYQSIVDSEFERLRAGETTLIDVILTEDQQVSAQLALSAARQDVAALVAELRYEMGALVPLNPAAIEISSLVTVPGAGGVK
ncbi:MAG: TolC family protein [Vicinamibacterales bacterium]